MICPRCELGNIKSIQFKKNGLKAKVCDTCEASWLEGELINFNTSHPVDSYLDSEDREYTIENTEEQDQEHRPVTYSKTK